MVKHAAPPYIADARAFEDFVTQLRGHDRVALDTEFVGREPETFIDRGAREAARFVRGAADEQCRRASGN